MQHFRCKCGKTTAFGSDWPKKCNVCKDCGSTLAQHPDRHPEPAEHDWKKEFSRSTGELSCERCQVCGDTRDI